MNLLDWLPPDAQKPVLAHELTHALQDQQVPLDKWELAGAKDDAALPDQQEYFVEEAQSARQCVTEGQAQVVWFDYTLAPMNKTILTAPEFVDAVRASMGDSKDSPVFRRSADVPAGIAADAIHLRPRLRANCAAEPRQGCGLQGTAEPILRWTRDRSCSPRPTCSTRSCRNSPFPNLGSDGRTELHALRFWWHGRIRCLPARQAIRGEGSAELLPSLARRLLLSRRRRRTDRKTRSRLMYFSRWDSPQAAKRVRPDCMPTICPNVTGRWSGRRVGHWRTR